MRSKVSDISDAAKALAVCVSTLFASFAGAADPSPEDLRVHYEKTVKAFEHVSYKAAVVVTYDGPKLPAGTLLEVSNYQVWRDGQRWKYLVDHSRYSPSRNSMEKDDQERLFPGKGFVWITKLPNIKGIFAFRIRARLDELADSENWMTYPDRIAVLHGHVTGNGTEKGPVLLPDVLAQSKLSSRRAEKTNKPTWLLEGAGRWGSVRLWLDPAAAYLPLRIEQHKKGADWGNTGKPLNSLERYPEGDSYYPAGRLIETSVIIDEVTTKRLGAVHVLTAFRQREIDRFDNRDTVTLTSRVRVSDVVLDPDFAKQNPFTLTTPVPDGTPVTVADEMQTPYVFRNGKITKLRDK